MRAVVQDRYGAPEVLRLDEVPDPVPGEGEVLLRVAATSVNLSDWETLTGSPLYARIGGFRRPARATLGSDIAGVVEQVGPGVTTFRPGDAVYGDNLDRKGGFAELASVPAKVLAPKPSALSFAEASAIPQAAAIALQGTRHAEAGTRMLINGAGGGSGAFAIQLAKAAGTHVTAVDNEHKLEFMRSLGADDVIDYRRDDFTRDRDPFDLVLDLVAHRSVFAYRRALAPGGRYLCVGGSVRALLRILTAGALLARATGRRMGLLAVREGPEHFGPLTDLIVEGAVDVHLDRTFPLEEVPGRARPRRRRPGTAQGGGRRRPPSLTDLVG